MSVSAIRLILLLDICSIADCQSSASLITHSKEDWLNDGKLVAVRDFPHSSCTVGIYDPLCWQSLNMSAWLRDWYQRLETCPSGNNIDTRACRPVDEPWTTTFLRVAQNITGGPGCTELNAYIDNPPTSKDIQFPDAEEAARYRYVCYIMHGKSKANLELINMLNCGSGINFFFSNWYQGMYNAAIESGNLVNNIVLAVDPPNTRKHVLVSDVLGALSAGLAFLAIPEAAALAGAAAVIAPLFVKAIQQAPGIAKLIWPLGTSQRETIEIGQLYGQLSTILQGLAPRIQGALAAVMGQSQNDITGFLAFAEQGIFSRPRDQWPDIVNDTRGLLVGFTTFLVSEALILGGWHVSVALGVNPLKSSGPDASCPYWQCDCGKFLSLDCTGYDNYSQCENNPWWYSNRTNSAYTLSKDPYNGFFHSSTHNEKNPTHLMRTIFENGWSSGALLLENAGLCVLQSSVANSFKSPTLRQQLSRILPALNSLTRRPEPCRGAPPSSRGFFIEEISRGTLRLNHPNDTLYNFTEGGIVDFNCTSQLNLTVFRDWASVWYLHRDLF